MGDGCLELLPPELLPWLWMMGVLSYSELLISKPHKAYQWHKPGGTVSARTKLDAL